MAGSADGRLTRLLGDPELAWLLERVRRRLELGHGLDGTVMLAGATIGQREAVERLLGRPPRNGHRLSVSLPAVDAVLRRSGLCLDGLAAAVVALGGPISIRADALSAQQRAWERAFAPLAEAIVIDGRPQLEAWLTDLRARGLVKRLEPDPAAAGDLLALLAGVVCALPAGGEPIGRFAARVARGAHALDDGRPLATLVLGAARALAAVAPAQPGESEGEWRREVWAAVGLMSDELSSVVLCAGLPADAATVSGRILAIGTDSGQPVALTLRQLVSDQPRWRFLGSPPLVVRVCENPVVLAMAADRFGDRCPALVCTSGQPSAAVMVLLRGLAAAGARLSHHGDFDWGGLRIGNVLQARLPIVPWRFDAASYARALADRPGPPLRGPPSVASWDDDLAPALRQSGRAIEEEAVIDELLDDLEPRGVRMPHLGDADSLPMTATMNA